MSRARRERFEERDEYLGSRINAPSPQLCQVMQQAADIMRRDAGRRPGSRSGWEGFPWLTMVFGSGALELHDGSGLAAQGLAESVAEIISSEGIPWDEGPDEASPATKAHNFALELVSDRMGKASTTDETLIDPAPSVEPAAAKLVYAAYLLTRFFHSVRAEMDAPTSRWEDDVAVLENRSGRGEDGPPAEAQEAAVRLASQATRLLHQIREILDQEPPGRRTAHPAGTTAPAPIRASVSALLNQVIRRLEPSGPVERRELAYDHLRLITEVAWYFLTLGTPIYPGWTQLLLGLMLSEGARPARGFRRARPRYPDLRSLPRLVAGIYENPTTTSWSATMDRLRHDGIGLADVDRSVTLEEKQTDRDHLYWAAAEVLWSQAEAGARIAKDQRPLPPAAAFVTSFDLELDMALLITARGRKFRVVLPVHLMDQAGEAVEGSVPQAELCWFIADIVPHPEMSPAAQLAALRHPDCWQVLTSDFDPAELRSTPIVIHLSGCPLLHLPDPGNAMDRQVVQRILAQFGEGDAGLQDAAFDHAVLVDEYLALRQSEAELIWSSRDPRGLAGGRQNRALHQDLMINDLASPRFWMAMGVPVGDPAVRHRLASQLTRQRIVALTLPDAARPAPPNSLLGTEPPPAVEVLPAAPLPARGIDSAVGAAVNTRIGDDETSLLYWMGFDVVQTDCNGFIGDLRHYTRHIEHSGHDKQPPLTQTCPLMEDET